jgi:hypothetical protein
MNKINSRILDNQVIKTDGDVTVPLEDSFFK